MILFICFYRLSKEGDFQGTDRASCFWRFHNFRRVISWQISDDFVVFICAAAWRITFSSL